MKQFYKKYELYFLIAGIFIALIYQTHSFRAAIVFMLHMSATLLLGISTLLAGIAILIFGKKRNGWNLTYVKEKKIPFLLNGLGSFFVLACLYCMYIGMRERIEETLSMLFFITICPLLLIRGIMKIIRIGRNLVIGEPLTQDEKE